MTTATTITAQPSVHRPRRRALLSVAVAAALAVGAGAAAVSLTSSDGTTSHRATPTAVLATKIDVPALWNQLATLPANERDNIVAGLTPDVRAQLQATAELVAVAAAHH